MTYYHQVEYYFSDENLPSDKYLLGKTEGEKNLPVSIKNICGFPKMRRYKPYRSVVESLKKSALLEVVDDKYIKRKTPLTLQPTVTPEEIQATKEEDQKKSNLPPADQPWMTKGMVSLSSLNCLEHELTAGPDETYGLRGVLCGCACGCCSVQRGAVALR